MKWKLGLASGVVFAFLLVNCATDQAAKVRGDRPFTLGLLEVGVRPVPSLGFNIDGLILPAASSGVKLQTSAKDRNWRVRSQLVEAKVLYFPFASSAFYTGLGGMQTSDKGSFDEVKAAGQTAPVARVSYKETDTYGRLPLGWYWIWLNGLTLSCDFGPRYRTHKVQEISGGSSSDFRDSSRFIDQSLGTVVSAGGLVMLGYSF